jgi:hypothetical protein
LAIGILRSGEQVIQDPQRFLVPQNPEGLVAMANGVGVGNHLVGFADAGNIGEGIDGVGVGEFCLGGGIGGRRSLQKQRHFRGRIGFALSPAIGFMQILKQSGLALAFGVDRRSILHTEKLPKESVNIKENSFCNLIFAT